jgi:hypothetical protein
MDARKLAPVIEEDFLSGTDGKVNLPKLNGFKPGERLHNSNKIGQLKTIQQRQRSRFFL